MKNKELNNVFRNFSRKVIIFLRQEALKEKSAVPIKTVRKIKIDGPSQAQLYYKDEPDLGLLLLKYEKILFNLPEAHKLVNELKKDKAISKHLDTLVGTKRSAFRITTDGCLRMFLAYTMEDSNDLEWDKSIFEKHYNYFERAFYEDTIPYRAIAILENFTGDFDIITVTDKLKIIKIPKNELEELWERSEFNTSRDRDKIWQNEYGVEIQYEDPKVINNTETTGSNDSIPKEEIKDLLTALRLYKPGLTGINFIEYKTQIPSVLVPGIQSTGGLMYQPYIGSEYKLSTSEKNGLINIFKSLQTAKTFYKQGYLDAAIRRFEYGYNRLLPKDRLIDYMIALEAIFLKGGEQQELSYRLSLRCAFFLGKKKQRKEIFDYVKSSYVVRSNILHGERSRDEIDYEKFALQIENYLRLSIKKILFEKIYREKQKLFLEKLDKIILG